VKIIKNRFNKITVLLFFSLFVFSIVNNRVLAIDSSTQTQNRVSIQNQSDNKETWLNKIKKRIFGESTNKGSVLSVNEIPHDKTIRKYTEGKVLIKYKKNKINLKTKSGASTAVNLAKSKSLEKEQNLDSENVSVLKIKDGKTVEEKIAELKNDPNIEFVQPNYQYEATVISSNDTYKGNLWGLDNTGQTVNSIVGTPDADIDIPEAWSISEGSTMVVAVIDNGVGYSHPDLAANMWDGSSCVGDEIAAPIDGGCPNHGYNFMDASNYGSYSSNFDDIDPLDPNQDFILPSPNPNTGNHWAPHGTHVAGTIAAVKNNAMGIMGVAPQAKIMALKTYYYTNEIVRSINFANNNGVKIINASFGGYNWDDCSMYDAIKNFNGLFIISAMNDSYDVDSGDPDKIAYPAGFGLKSECGPGLDNIIVVAATTNNDDLATFSNYGLKTVNIGAPGKDIISVGIGESGQANYYFANGTSMAAPHVSGLAALLWGYKPNLTLYDVKAAILYNGESIPSLSGKTVTGKRINAQLALQNAKNYDTNKIITSFSINGIGTSGIINGTNIGITVPVGTNITNLTPIISSNSINTTPIDPPSAQAQDFTDPIIYTVIADDTSTKNYTVTVSATGSSAASVPVPSAPTNLSGTPGSNQVTLNWDAPVDVGSSIADYKIEFGIGSSWTTFVHENPIMTTQTIVNGLTNGVDYNFRISAINQTGVGATSSVITVKAGSSNKNITGFAFSGIGVSGIINGTNIGVTVPYGTDVTNLNPTITIDVGASISPSSGVAQDFTNTVVYTVTAENTSTQNYNVTVTIAPVPVPSAPSNLTVIPGDSKVLLSWTGPTDVGSSLIQYQIGYKLNSGEDSDWTAQVVDTSEINVSNIEITGLTNGTSYDFRVAAVNQTGPGAYVRSNGIIPLADFTNLNIAITLAQSLYNSAVGGTNYGQYPNKAIDDFQSAITVATGVRSNLTSNQDQVDLAVNALNSAISTFRATKIVPSNIGATNLSDLITYGTFTTTPNSENPGEISKISVANNITINIGNSGSLNTVYLPKGIEITEHNDQFFNTSELSAEVVDKNTLSDLGSGFNKEAAIQWGIPNKTLMFSDPITINIFVGTDLNGRILNVLRSPNGSSGWTNEGIVSPATCVVSSGYCQFLATQASYFVAASYESPNQQNTNNNNNPGPKICTDTPPIDNPDLFEIKTIKGSVKLFYTPTSKATSYAVLYGLKKGDERFGTFINTINENKGVQNIDINMLNPKITYYFKVAAVNGCTMGPWSEWVPAKANRKNTIYKYKTIFKNRLKTLVNIFK